MTNKHTAKVRPKVKPVNRLKPVPEPKLEVKEEPKGPTVVVANQAQSLFADLIEERKIRFQWMLKAQEINRDLVHTQNELRQARIDIHTLTLEAIRLKSKDLSQELKISEYDTLTNEHLEHPGEWVIIKKDK